MGVLSKIRLELARTREHPDGERRIGYEFCAPLDEQGMIDVQKFRENRESCTVRRFRANEEHEDGRLVRKPGRAWSFHYDVHGDPSNDEAGFKFGNHRFVVGEYVSIREEDVQQPYRVVSILQP